MAPGGCAQGWLSDAHVVTWHRQAGAVGVVGPGGWTARPPSNGRYRGGTFCACARQDDGKGIPLPARGPCCGAATRVGWHTVRNDE